MKKLKLVELEVVSFETAPATPGERGTVHANAKPTRNCTGIGCDSFICPTTPDMDCTYGCTRYAPECFTSVCFTEADCVPVTDLDCVATDLDCTLVP